MIKNTDRGINNYLRMSGIEFIEFANQKTEFIENILYELGFSKLNKFRNKDIYHFNQNDIHILLNNEKSGFSYEFAKEHGPAIVSMGWRVSDAKFAIEEAVKRGATKVENDKKDLPYPAILGIGNSLIYFIEECDEVPIYRSDFLPLECPILKKEKGFISIDHLTNNVHKGTLKQWSDFYKNIFGFSEVKYFDIRGLKTGLTSFALRSPCGKFCIPINEGNEEKSQIEEYLREYNGPGVQHIAFLSNDLLNSVRQLNKSVIETLDIDDDYYKTIFNRVPYVSEDKKLIRKYQVLVDGDENGYLLQIFTKNLFGPIFIELIQRKNNDLFGEGNFEALFRSIERDQEKRGVL